MIKPEFPSNEHDRVSALKSYRILDTLPEKEYDALTFIASQIFDAPISLISLIDPCRQWFKSRHGLEAVETGREIAFCAHAINQPDRVLVVPDSRKDPRFVNNPLATEEPHVIFYAGAPLNTSSGFTLGTLCVIDNKPRVITAAQEKALKNLADQVVSLFDLRKNNFLLEEKNLEISALNERLSAFGARLTHDLKAPVRGIRSLVRFIDEDYGSSLNTQIRSWLQMMDKKGGYIDNVIDGMLEYSRINELEVQYEDFNPTVLIDDITQVLTVPKEIVLNVETDANLIIYQYKFGVASVLQNLISNSIKYSDKEDCSIKIKLVEESDNYLFVYEDNGPGISAEDRDIVFNLFENLGVFDDKSTGVGLATVHSILQRLGGSIRVLDRADGGEGIRFLISLPILKSDQSPLTPLKIVSGLS